MFSSSLQRIKRVWREWPYLGIGMLAAALALLGGCFYLQRQGNNITPVSSEVLVEPTSAASSDWPAGFVRRSSDGQPIPPEEQPKRWFGVMVENSAEAWPLSGLSQARLVIEAPVEGNIPRFMAYFDENQEVEKIGPVRSLRPYYLDWAMGFKAMPAHVGGSPEALSLVDQTRTVALNEFYWGRFFWRSGDRYAPHNVYTSIDRLNDGYEARGLDDVEIPSFVYSDVELAADSCNPSVSFTVPFSPLTTDYDATWSYDDTEQAYLRAQGKERNISTDEQPVAAKNVIVMYADILVIDHVGRRSVKTIGSGKLLLAQDGRTYEGTWEKDSRLEPLRFLDADGKDLPLRAGSTWIEVVPLSTKVKLAPARNCE